MADVSPAEVHATLDSHMLVDGYPLVVDLERSTPFSVYDAREGREYLDFFTYFASAPFGNNHPDLANPEFIEKIGRVAVNKPSNSDLYTIEMAELVEIMSRTCIPDYLPHLFFVSGGALAVENALKVAFDWKVRRNMAAGRISADDDPKDGTVLHFTHAFHGRSGYTMSLTNTADPRKYMYFPRFDWPRVDPPILHFPVDEGLAEINDTRALAAVEETLASDPDRIAAVIIEPVQAEGGDNHFTTRFLQGLRDLCDEYEALFIMDEVQTGLGLTGRMWAHEHFNGARPDIIAFGKKAQICGILAGPRIDEVEGNCFEESSRINSTWGGNLVDMVRFTRILEIIERDNLVENARVAGDYLLDQLRECCEEFESVSNVRGRGLMCAFDLSDSATRDAVLKGTLAEGMLILGCGEKSIRFRPPLQTTPEHVDAGIELLRKVLAAL